MTFFTQENGTLLPEKGHLAKPGGGGLPPPRVPTPLIIGIIPTLAQTVQDYVLCYVLRTM